MTEVDSVVDEAEIMDHDLHIFDTHVTLDNTSSDYNEAKLDNTPPFVITASEKISDCKSIQGVSDSDKQVSLVSEPSEICGLQDSQQFRDKSVDTIISVDIKTSHLPQATSIPIGTQHSTMQSWSPQTNLEE